LRRENGHYLDHAQGRRVIPLVKPKEEGSS